MGEKSANRSRVGFSGLRPQSVAATPFFPKSGATENKGTIAHESHEFSRIGNRKQMDADGGGIDHETRKADCESAPMRDLGPDRRDLDNEGNKGRRTPEVRG